MQKLALGHVISEAYFIARIQTNWVDYPKVRQEVKSWRRRSTKPETEMHMHLLEQVWIESASYPTPPFQGATHQDGSQM